MVEGTLMVRNGKGGKDRTTVISKTLLPELNRHLIEIKERFAFETIPVSMPDAIERKYLNAGMELVECRYLRDSRVTGT